MRFLTFWMIAGMVGLAEAPPVVDDSWLDCIVKLGAIGVLGGILWWKIAKTDPARDAMHAEMIDKIMIHNEKRDQHAEENSKRMAAAVDQLGKRCDARWEHASK